MKNILSKIIILVSIFLAFASPAMAATLTVYPDADPESTTQDGYVANNNISGWSTARNATAGTSVTQDTDEIQALADSTGNFWIQRNFLLWDTSALTAGATISSAVVSMYVIGGATEGNRNVDFVSSTPASNTTLVTEDFDQIGTTSFCNYTPATGSGYSGCTLNASGLAAISKTGITKFALLHNKDFSNTQPTSRNYVGFNAAEHTGTSQDPKLVVTYSTGRIMFTTK